MHKFDTVSTESIDRKFDDVFDRYYDDVYSTKKTYRHSEPGLSYKYKYMYEECEVDNGEWLTILRMVVLPESFCKEKRREISETTGVDEEDLDEFNVMQCGWAGCVPFGSENLKLEEDEDGNVDEGVVEARLEELRDTVATCLSAFDGLYGFYMDRPVNMIGTTGWDLVYEAKGKIKDALKYAMKRLEKGGQP